MNNHSDAIAFAEQQVAEARTAALAEYQVARVTLRRHISSPALIGSVLLGAIGVGYLALGRGKPKRLVCQGSPGVWTRLIETMQMLSLLMAFHSATKTAYRPRASISK